MNSLLKQRWTEDTITDDPCLTETDEDSAIRLVAKELGLAHGLATWVPEEDLAFGLELLSILRYCPSHVVEAVRLSMFVESILTNHNLNTLIAATVHNIQPRAGDNVKDFTATNMWYKRLDERYNFSLGPAIIGLMTSNSLKELISLESPFLKDYNAFNIDQRLDNMTALFGK